MCVFGRGRGAIVGSEREVGAYPILGMTSVPPVAHSPTQDVAAFPQGADQHVANPDGQGVDQAFIRPVEDFHLGLGVVLHQGDDGLGHDATHAFTLLSRACLHAKPIFQTYFPVKF